MKKSLITAILASFAFLFVLASVETANAQPNWSRRYNRNNVNQAIRRLENQTDLFTRELDRALDRTRMNNTRREANIEARARAFERETDELRREFDRFRDNWWETRNNVSQCINAARNLNSLMRDRRLNNLTRNRWANVQRELNSLARIYGLPRV